MSDVTNFEINKLEQLFLEFIDYKLVIKGSEYAKYYFILRNLADDLTHLHGEDEEATTISPLAATILASNIFAGPVPNILEKLP